MTAPRFLIASLALFIGILATYAVVVDKLVIVARQVPYSYRQFLLESAGDIGGKVIVESGSNSVHSIDPFLLSAYFEAPVLTTAGNAGYPLRLRILNLQNHLQPGDVLLLPLEWNQYQSESHYSENFLQAVADEDLRLEFFYNGLPLLEKLRFIFLHYPTLEAWRGFGRNRQPAELRQQDLARLEQFDSKIRAFDNDSFGNSMRNRTGDRKDPLTARLGCNQYLFASQLRSGFTISETFEANLALLERLASKGVRIYFTWPAVVDSARSTCYRGTRLTELLDGYTAGIESMLMARGLPLIGQYRDSHFPSACFLDTYYHLRRDCADQRTVNLMAALSQYGVEPIPDANGQENLAKQVQRRISRLRSELLPSSQKP